MQDPNRRKLKRRRMTQTPSDRKMEAPTDRNGKDQEKENFFARLSDELVLQVLSRLSLADLACRASLVSRRFRDLCRDPSLWTRLKLPTQQLLSTGQAEQLLLRCSMLRELDVTHRWVTDVEQMTIFALQHCPRLGTLCSPSISKEVLEAIAEHGQSLRSISEHVLVEGQLAETPKCLRNLTSISLHCISEQDLKAIADNCRNLEESQFTYFPEQEDGMDYFLEAVKNSIRCLKFSTGVSLEECSLRNIDKCQLLEKLGVEYKPKTPAADLKAMSRLPRLTSLSIDMVQFTKDYVHAFSSKMFRRLTCLDLGCSYIKDQGLEAVAKNCPELTSLRLQGCFGVTDVGIKCVLEQCGKLRSLYMRIILTLTRTALDGLPVLLPGLKELWVLDCSRIDEKSIENIREKMPELVVEFR